MNAKTKSDLHTQEIQQSADFEILDPVFYK